MVRATGRVALGALGELGRLEAQVAAAGALRIDAEQVLDLSEAVRQYRETALPMQPLCRPGCAGLCPTCGRDLNLGACSCPEEPADARWSALAELGRRARKS